MKSVKIFEALDIKNLAGKRVDIVAEVKHAYDYSRGCNVFSITGIEYIAGHRVARAILSNGCIHEKIKKAFPELAPLIKWHMCSTKGPLHYLANSLYHSRDRDHAGVEIGAPVKYETTLAFADFPITFVEQRKGFWTYLNSIDDFNNVEVIPVPYDGRDKYDSSPCYSLTGYIKDSIVYKWNKAPFGELKEAEEFLEALRRYDYHYVKTPIVWCKAVEPDLEAARNYAIWPEADLKDFTKEKLEARLPGLLEEFRKDVESIGLTY